MLDRVFDPGNLLVEIILCRKIGKKRRELLKFLVQQLPLVARHDRRTLIRLQLLRAVGLSDARDNGRQHVAPNDVLEVQLVELGPRVTAL